MKDQKNKTNPKTIPRKYEGIEDYGSLFFVRIGDTGEKILIDKNKVLMDLSTTSKSNKKLKPTKYCSYKDNIKYTQTIEEITYKIWLLIKKLIEQFEC